MIDISSSKCNRLIFLRRVKKCEREFGDHVCEKSTWRHAVGTKTNAEPNQ